MPSANAFAAEAPIFSVLLTPYRSLGQKGLTLVMVVLGAMSSAIGVAFWLIGAWPVAGFLGLDVALLYVAFRLNNRAARAAEEISITRRLLSVRKIAPDGRAAETGFNPYWARVEVDRHPEFGVTRLLIASHGRRLGIAGFLAPRQRESLATALIAALARVRSTPPR